jgi:hypothetical protein
MKRRLKMLGLSVAVAAVLTLSIVGTVGAAGNPGNGAQTQNQGAECLCGQCPCGDCISLACDPIDNDYDWGYNYDHDYLVPGPHGTQNLT